MRGMRRRLLGLCLTGLIAAGMPVAPSPAQSSFKLAAALTPAEYQEKLAQYLHARRAYEQETERYWTTVAEKRTARRVKRRKHERLALTDYVLSQPPVYRGPPRPINPAGPGPVPGETHRFYIPVVADFLKSAAKEFGFAPQQVSEIAFKRAYAKAAREAGLTRDQIVGIYAFETDGHGTYDEQPGITPRRPHGPAISPALGYNQLLSTNTISLIADHGNHMLAALRQKAKTLSGAERSSWSARSKPSNACWRSAARSRRAGAHMTHRQDHAARLGHARRGARPRSRPHVAGAEPGGLAAVCARQRL